MNETRNKTQANFSLDREVLREFDRIVPNGERSSTVNEIMKDYLIRSGSLVAKNSSDIQSKIKGAKEELEKLLAIERLEEEANLAKQKKEEMKLIKAQSDVARQHFLDTSRMKAKQLVNLEFSLDPLTDVLPSYFTDDLRAKYRARWKELTEEIIQKGPSE